MKTESAFQKSVKREYQTPKLAIYGNVKKIVLKSNKTSETLASKP